MNDQFDKFPRDPQLTLNQARSKERYTIFQNQGGKRALAGVANYNISLRDWIQYAIDKGWIIIDPNLDCDDFAACLLLVDGLNIQIDGSGAIATPWIVSGYGIEPTANENEYRVTRPNGSTFLFTGLSPGSRRVKDHAQFKFSNTSQQNFAVPLPALATPLSTSYYTVFVQGQLMSEGTGDFEWQLINDEIVFDQPIVATPGDPQRVDIYYEYTL